MKFRLTLKSSNRKTGPIPVSTSSSDTCPDNCPLRKNGCYADGGPLGIVWKQTDKAGLAWKAFLREISNLPQGIFWRHNQAGDLPGKRDSIDTPKLADLVKANQGKRGFTYTHKPPTTENREAISAANRDGFTVNLSADNLEEADELAELAIGPVVTLLPSSVTGPAKLQTPNGRRVVVCPATYRDDVSCASCQLCQVATRKSIVGFPAHGSSHKKASAVANA